MTQELRDFVAEQLFTAQGLRYTDDLNSHEDMALDNNKIPMEVVETIVDDCLLAKSFIRLTSGGLYQNKSILYTKKDSDSLPLVAEITWNPDTKTFNPYTDVTVYKLSPFE